MLNIQGHKKIQSPKKKKEFVAMEIDLVQKHDTKLIITKSPHN